VFGPVPLVVLVALAAAPPASPPPPGDPALEARREKIAEEILRVGAALRREIEAGDVTAVAARVPPSGLRCAGRIVPRDRVARDLGNPRSWLHGLLFGGPGYVPAAGAPASLRQFFRNAPEIGVLVAFQRDPRAGPVGRPCLDFRAPTLPTPGTPFCWERVSGRWMFTESLYPCR
jgi:hypothetical protein